MGGFGGAMMALACNSTWVACIVACLARVCSAIYFRSVLCDDHSCLLVVFHPPTSHFSSLICFDKVNKRGVGHAHFRLLRALGRRPSDADSCRYLAPPTFCFGSVYPADPESSLVDTWLRQHSAPAVSTYFFP